MRYLTHLELIDNFDTDTISIFSKKQKKRKTKTTSYIHRCRAKHKMRWKNKINNKTTRAHGAQKAGKIK